MNNGEDEGEVFLGRSVSRHKEVSEKTAEMIDGEVKDLLESSYAEAKQILVDNMDILHAMAEALIKYETIDENQLADLMARRPYNPPKGWSDDDKPKRPSAGKAASDSETKGPKPGDEPVTDN